MGVIVNPWLRWRLPAWIIACQLCLLGATGASFAQEFPQVFVDRGILEYDEGNYEEALNNFLQALDRTPEDAVVRYYLGLTFMALDRPGEAIVHLEKARGLEPNDLDVAFTLGVAYSRQGDYEAALPHLRFVHTQQPSRENLGFYLGQIHFRRQEYDQALAYFEKNSSGDVEFQQLTRYYIGLSKHYLGRTAEATETLSAAVNLQPLSPLALTARKFLETVAPPPEARPFRLEARTGVQYDTNVRVAPTENLLNLQGPRRGSVGETVYARGEYDIVRTPIFSATASYAFLQVFNNQVTDFDIMDHTGGLETTYKGYIAALPALVGLQYNYERLLLGQKDFVERHYVTPYLTLSEADWSLTTLQYRFETKDFKSPLTAGLPEENRDARNYLAGFTHFFLFAGGRHYIKLGYQYDAEVADGLDYTYHGHKAIAGFQVTLPTEVRLLFNYELHRRIYPEPNALATLLNESGTAGTSFNTRRRDTDHSFLVVLSKKLSKGFTVSLDYFGEWNHSSFSLFDFNRNVMSFNVIWRY
ncbi:MAG: tetratricopeptide repeat protein [candidate division NC10 bacterium]|nr:tetratricopeptide repeat protein [candidate division NC10 bacterium]